jgi:hypothetical protein
MHAQIQPVKPRDWAGRCELPDLRATMEPTATLSKRGNGELLCSVICVREFPLFVSPRQVPRRGSACDGWSSGCAVPR